MQKLIWKNSLGNEINLTKAPYGIIEWEGFSNAPINIQSQQVPFQDGSVFLDALIEQRELTVILAMQDNGNLKERYKMRRELIHIFNPKLGEGYLIYTNDFISKRIKCVAQIPLFENHNSNDSGTPKASLSWTACEPYWEDLEETSVIIRPNERTNINYQGEVDVKPKINFWGNSTNPKIRNIDNNTKLSMNGNISDFVADLSFGHKTFNKEKLYFSTLGNINGFAEFGANQILYGQSINVTKDLVDFEISLNPGNSQIDSICSFQDGIILAGGGELYVSYNDGETWDEVELPDVGSTPFVRALIIKYEITHVFIVVINHQIYECQLNTETKEFTFTYRASLPNAPSCWVRQKEHPDAYIIFCDNINGNISEYNMNNYTVSLIEADTSHKINSIILSPEDNYYYLVGKNGWARKTVQLVAAFTVSWNTFLLPSGSENLNCVYYDSNTKNYFVCGHEGKIYVGKHKSGMNYTWVTKTVGTLERYYIGFSKLFGQIQVTGQDILIYKNGEFQPIIEYPQNTLCGAKFKDKYFAGGIEGEIYVSDDFKIWREIFRSEHISKPLYFAEESANHELCFFTKDGDIIYTTNGSDFSIKRNIAVQIGTPYLCDVCYFNGKYYISGGSNHKDLYESSDRINWTKVTGFNSDYRIGNMFNIEYVYQEELTKDLMIITEHHDVYTSSNGEDFSKIEDVSSANIPWGVYNNNLIFTVDSNLAINQMDSSTGNISTLYTYADFVTQEEIEQGVQCVIYHNVANNHLFISVMKFIPDEQQYRYEGKVYLSDNNQLTLLLSDEHLIQSFVQYFENGEYIINSYYLDVNAGFEKLVNFKMSSDFTVDLDSITDGVAMIDNGNSYLKVAENPEDSDIWSLYKNGRKLGEFYDNELNVANDLIIRTDFNHNAVFSSSDSFESLSSPFNFDDEDKLSSIIKYNDSFYSLIGDRISYFKSIDDNLTYVTDAYAFCIYENKIYVGWGNSYGKISSVIVYNMISPTEVEFLFSNSISSSHDEPINNACISNGSYFIYATDGYIEVIDIYNSILYEFETIVQVYEFTDKNGSIIGIGGGGFVLCSGIQNITEISNNAFTFTKFVRNEESKFVGLLYSLGYIEFKSGENIVSLADDVSFTLSVGDNNVLLIEDSGYMIAEIKYRKKYIGV